MAPQLSGAHVLKSIFLVLDTFPASLSIAATQSQTTSKQNSKSAGIFLTYLFFNTVYDVTYPNFPPHRGMFQYC